jgi:Zn-dependent membrane protease YugP
MFFDWSYLLWVALPAMVISGIAQMFVTGAYSKYSRVRNGRGMTGPQVADAIFDRTSLAPIPIQGVAGQLTDHFDPQQNVVRLSEGNVSQPSIAAMAITAHELGHVQQYQSRSPLIALRQFLVPAVQFGPNIAYMLILAGIMLNFIGLAYVGLALFGLSTVFMLITLPVEIDASRRAMVLLQESGLLVTEEDRQGARQVLMAAAATYLAALITSVLTLLYYVSLVNRSRD